MRETAHAILFSFSDTHTLNVPFRWAIEGIGWFSYLGSTPASVAGA